MQPRVCVRACVCKERVVLQQCSSSLFCCMFCLLSIAVTEDARHWTASAKGPSCAESYACAQNMGDRALTTAPLLPSALLLIGCHLAGGSLR